MDADPRDPRIDQDWREEYRRLGYSWESLEDTYLDRGWEEVDGT
jgi:hypothetical protein|tara:strand:+ start:355 stop:486 length:132 start_codon:yes stop_codon:yes gene_type:complete